MIYFAVAYNEYETFGILFSEEYNQNITIQCPIMNFKHSFNDQPTPASFITLIG